jgi:hypothetical protein
MIFMYRNYDSTGIQIVNRMFLIHWAYNGTSLWGKEIKERSGKSGPYFRRHGRHMFHRRQLKTPMHQRQAPQGSVFT